MTFGEGTTDTSRLRIGHLERLREELRARDLAAAVLLDPVNICYATESYIGADGGPEGVKLEEQVLVTATGVELLSHFPFDGTLLGREV